MFEMNNEGYRFYCLGVDSLGKGDLKLALKCFKRSFMLEEHFKTCERIADVLIAMDRLDESIAYMKQAFLMNENNSQVAVKYATLLVEQDANSQARVILRNVLDNNPTYGPAKKLIKTLNASTQ